MSEYITVVIRMPEDAKSKEQVQSGLELLKPHQTSRSPDDKATVLDLIEQHEDFPDYIAEEARARVQEIHAKAESAEADDEDIGPDPEDEFVVTNDRRLEREHERDMDVLRDDT